jgi:hypothetical protein
MARNPEKFYYVEVALPKDNAAVEQMVAESERLSTPLHILIRQACLNMYSGEAAAQPSTRKASTGKKTPRAKKPAASNAVPTGAVDSANAFLDDDGF